MARVTYDHPDIMYLLRRKIGDELVQRMMKKNPRVMADIVGNVANHYEKYGDDVTNIVFDGEQGDLMLLCAQELRAEIDVPENGYFVLEV